MTLIKSISGIRGTIGGKPGEGLTPLDIVKFTAAYARWIAGRDPEKTLTVVLGRDARISGEMVENIVSGTLTGMGVNVYSLGFATTPSVELAVAAYNADGGIILTASHNPGEWNALKLLNEKGEFLSAADGEEIISYTLDDSFTFSSVGKLGKMTRINGFTREHIDHVLNLKLVNTQAIRESGFRVAIDCVNSVGGIILPDLLKALGIKEVIELYCDPNGLFPHNPEPLPENLTRISELVREKKADLGFVVDPDVDRLAVICEDGSMFGEEYTLVAVADYVLTHTPGNTASNLSSTRALRDITVAHGQEYFSSPVGEVNVVHVMKENNCVIGGEGNGGVIYPASHYGRDALVGIALFLSLLAERKQSCSNLRKSYPQYVISKNKISLPEDSDIGAVLQKVRSHYRDEKIDERDGIKIDFPSGWVHLRKSNTEPIIRIYAEASNQKEADDLALKIIKTMQEQTNK